MKKTKKLLALVLAMMMAFSLMAMPAMAVAADDDGIMPVGTMIQCDRCGAWVEFYSYSQTVNCSCKKNPNPHTKTTTYSGYSCSCGNSRSFTSSDH